MILRTAVIIVVVILAVVAVCSLIVWALARRCPYCRSKRSIFVIDGDNEPVGDWWFCKRCGSFF